MDARRTEPAFDPGGEIFDNSRFFEAVTDVSAVRPAVAGSITTILPDSRAPACRNASRARRLSSRPPVTIGADRASALNVPGPQVPSAGQSDIALELCAAPRRFVAEDAVDAADWKPSSVGASAAG